MKLPNTLICLAAMVIIISCKKKDTPTPLPDNYSSTSDFFLKNDVVMQTYTINGSTGGSFTSPQGTVVTIPANAFITKSNIPVTGNVIIQFKDMYRKSDMFFSDITTETMGGAPLKSGGEFFIKAIFDNSSIVLANGKNITVNQPAALTGGLDTVNGMQPFVRQPDTAGNRKGWIPAAFDTVTEKASSYIYHMYQFKTPVDSGSWCNSDNSSYFAAYPQTILMLHPNDKISDYNQIVFLVFKNISSMVHVYYDGTDFPYSYAPQGLQCTLVAVGVRNGVLYSSFVPVTISSNQTVNFSLSKTTTNEFISQLKLLN
jgi:hypothetical protein